MLLKRKSRKESVLFVGLFIYLFFFSGFAVAQQSSSKVTSDDMQLYAQTVISIYNQYLNTYFSSVEANGGFSFHSNNYNVTSFISSNGAALWIQPSDVRSLQNFTLSDRIESIFGGNFSLFPTFEIPVNGKNIIIEGGGYTLNGHPFIDLGTNGSVIIKDVQLTQLNFTQNSNFTQYYNIVLMKGSIETSYWSHSNAISDAESILYSDSKNAFVNSQEFDELVAEPELTSLLQNIKNNLTNNSTYTALDWLADMQHVKTVAEEFGLINPDDFINEIIAFLNAETTGILPTIPPTTSTPNSLETSPSPNLTNTTNESTPNVNQAITFRILFWSVNDFYGGWLYIGALCIFVGLALIALVVFGEAKEKYPSLVVRALFASPMALISLVIAAQLFPPPTNFHPNGGQDVFFGVIGAIWLLVCIFELKNYRK